MPIAAHRLLGFAFASADLLLEIGAQEKITFAIGAAATLSGAEERQLIGRTWREFVDDRDQSLIEALFAGMTDGARTRAVVARLAGTPAESARAFALCACRLPQNGGVISCALTRASPLALGPGEGGLHDRDSFEAVTKTLFETARATGEELELAFVEMEGLDAAAKRLPGESRKALQARLGGALRAQSHGGAAAAKLGDDRFALVRQAGEAPETLTARLARLLAMVAEVQGVKLAARSIALNGDVSPSQIVRAVRFALDDFIREGMAGKPPETLQDALNESVRHTLERANQLGSVLSERKFKLAFQPVVSLKTGELVHHEVLVRFGDDESPFPTIRMAEELDLIETLDLAIAEQAVGVLGNDKTLKLAVNISGRTITSPSFITAVEKLVGKQNALKGRLMFELTESAAIDDLAVANANIQVLRGLGCQVCLDDFGAGAASLAYLQQLSLDVVKIDGQYIRELQHGGRESTFIRHLVQMCAELGVKTLAEMVETAQAEEAVRKAGVDYAQGWLYGAASSKPERPASRPGPVAARRKGATESWG
ncbi:MAG: EAL domain-containing protein [Caulobacterales bacterium]